MIDHNAVKRVFIMLAVCAAAIGAFACGNTGSVGSTGAASGAGGSSGGSGGSSGSASGGTYTLAIAGSAVSSGSQLTVSPGGSVNISVTAKWASGALVTDGTPVTFALSDSTLGTVGTSGKTASGVAVTTFTASSSLSGSTAKTATVTATIGTAPSTISTSIDVVIVSTAPSSIAVTTSTPAKPFTIAPGETTIVSVNVLKSDGSAVPDGTSVTFSMTPASGMGTLTPATATTSSGVAQTTFTSSGTVGAVKVTATSGPAGATVTSSVDISVETTNVGSVKIDSSRQSITLAETSTITATVKDGAGRLANNVGVTFSLADTALGTLSAASAFTNSSGVATVTFAAKSLAGTEKITVTAGAFTDSTSIAIAVTVTPALNSAQLVTTTPEPTITVFGQIGVKAAVTVPAGSMLPANTAVTFTLSDSTLGSIAPSALTDNTGVATAVFTARGLAGTETVTTSIGNASSTVDIKIAVNVTLTASPSSVTTGGLSVIQATIKDAAGNFVPDGTIVKFSLNDNSMGSVTATASTVTGVATVSYSAGTVAGTAIVTAAVGGGTGAANIKISTAAAASIEFLAADNSIIGVRGSGKTESTPVQFMVKGSDGNPIADGTLVDFQLNGPSGGKLPDSGGEYVGERDASPTLSSSYTSGGVVKTTVFSGTVAGNLYLYATVHGTTVKTASPAISVGGGTVSERSFTVTADKFNIAGIQYAGDTANFQVYLADRFGNANLLKGTTVNFYPEAAATASSTATTDTSGYATVIYRTQLPLPQSAAEAAWETTLRNNLNAAYGLGFTTQHPRASWSTMLVTVRGEEAFNDANGNGIWDTGESFTASTCGEPFIDYNDNGVRDDGTGADPFEPYLDVNGNGQYDDGSVTTAVNGNCYSGTTRVWASNKLLFKNVSTIISGPPVYIKVNSADLATFQAGIANGGSATFRVLIADLNLNPMAAGTTVSVSATGKQGVAEPTVAGDLPYTFKNVFPTASAAAWQSALEITFSVGDPDNTRNGATTTTVTLTVDWKGNTYSYSFSGIMN